MPKSFYRCRYCGRVLIPIECYYYGCTCEGCEETIYTHNDKIPWWIIRLKCYMKRLFRRR